MESSILRGGKTSGGEEKRVLMFSTIHPPVVNREERTYRTVIGREGASMREGWRTGRIVGTSDGRSAVGAIQFPEMKKRCREKKPFCWNFLTGCKSLGGGNGGFEDVWRGKWTCNQRPVSGANTKKNVKGPGLGRSVCLSPRIGDSRLWTIGKIYKRGPGTFTPRRIV